MPLTVVSDILCDAVLLLVACRGRTSYFVGHTHANLSDKFTQSRLLVASSIVLCWCLLALLRHVFLLAIYYIGMRARALCLPLSRQWQVRV